MTTELVTTDQSTWQFVPETARPFADNIQALMYADALDEITQAPPGSKIQVTTGNSGVTPQASTSGRIGLVGRPLSLFSPGFIANASLSMTLTANGFLPLALSGTLAAQPNYPDAFAPIDLNSVWLHRSPITISGRTVAHDRTPLPGSTISIGGVWPTQATLTGAPTAANLIAITLGLYADQPLTASAYQYNVAPQTALAKQIVLPAEVGAMQIRLSDQIGLAPNGLLIIEWPDKDRSEIVTISAIVDAGVTPDQPATVVLKQALRRNHYGSPMAYPATAAAPGVANAFVMTGQAGDVTLSFGSMNGLDTSTTAIEISGGPASAEYHWAQVYQATSDVNGYFSLPPIHRFAQIQLHITNPSVLTPLDFPVTLDFGQSDLVVDLIFP